MVPALSLFAACMTQWRFAGATGVPTGLDYGAVEAAARMMALPVTPQLFADLRQVEAGALEELARR